MDDKIENKIIISIKGDMSDSTKEAIKDEFLLKLVGLEKYLTNGDKIELIAKYKKSIKIPDIILNINTNNSKINIKSSGKESLGKAIEKAKTILKKSHSKNCDKQTFTTRKVELENEENIESENVITANYYDSLIKEVFDLIDLENKLKELKITKGYSTLKDKFTELYEESIKFDKLTEYFNILYDIYRNSIYSLADKERLIDSMDEIKNDMTVSLSKMRSITKKASFKKVYQEERNIENQILSLKRNLNVK